MMIDLEKLYGEFDAAAVRSAMDAKGYYVFDNRLRPGELPGMKARIDELSQAAGTEVNYAGSEHRIWHAEEKDPAFAALQQLSDWIMPQIYGAPYPSHTVLAIRNRPVPPQAERHDVRWHLDSFRRQLKLFAFLTDVTEENGPLEYIPGTHKSLFKWAGIPRLGFYRLGDLRNLRNGKRSWQRIHDRQIEKVKKSGYEVMPFAVPAGTVALVETSALHRAKPCKAGERYAVTVYHR